MTVHGAGLASQTSYRPGMDRRHFLLTSLAGVFAAPVAAEAQQAGKVWRVGTLHTSSAKDAADRVAALERGLAELGYLAGRNVVLVNRNSGQRMSLLPELAADLIRSGVDVIVTSVNPATLAAKKATATIPIVMTVGVEPVAAGLVASLAKPGANVTGLTFDVDATELAAKRLEILKELIPSLSRVAVLWNPGYSPGVLRFKGTEDAGRKLGVTIVSIQLTEGSDGERAFTEMRNTRVEAVTVLSDPVTVDRRGEIIGLAARYRLPVIYAFAGVRRGRWPDIVCDQPHRAVASGRRLCGQDLQGCEARRIADRAADGLRTVDQQEGRQDDRPHDPAITTATGGSGD